MSGMGDSRAPTAAGETHVPLSGPVRVALVGYGLAGAVFHAPLIAANPDMRLATVVTSNRERAARAMLEHPGVRVVGDVEELWRGASDHDLVVVAAPNRAHVSVTLGALGAGLPAVVDKPVAATASDGRRLLTAAADRGLMLSVFQNRRLDGDFLTVRRLITEGALGRILRFESRFERWRPDRQADAWRERGGPEEGGGVLLDLGSHLVDQAIQLFGPPTHVYAEVGRRRAGAQVDDDVFIALEHASGVISHLWASQVARLPSSRMRVLGLAGAYDKQGLDPQEDQLGSGRLPTEPGYGVEPEESWGVLAVGDEAERIETERGSYPRFYEGIVAALRSGAPPPVDPADAVLGIEVLEAASASAASRAVVRFPAR